MDHPVHIYILLNDSQLYKINYTSQAQSSSLHYLTTFSHSSVSFESN